MNQTDRWETRERVLSAAAGWLSSYHYFEQALPGPNDDAEMEMKDEMLLDAARDFVKAHEGVETIRDKYPPS